MVDIQEIPLDIEETHENDADTEEINQEIIDIPAPKKKGDLQEQRIRPKLWS